MEPLNHAIALGMKCSHCRCRDPKRRANSSPDGGSKLCAPVGGKDSRNAKSQKLRRGEKEKPGRRKREKTLELEWKQEKGL